MRLHNPLDSILNNEIKVKVLRFLCLTNAEWNGRQIAKEIKVSPASCHKALRELNNERLLLLRNVGKSFLYRLNNDNIIVSTLLKPLYQKEDRIPHTLFNTIKRGLSPSVKKSIVSLAVFGSIFRKEEQATSDIDILVILMNTNDKKVIAKEFEKLNEQILHSFGNTVSPYYQTVKELKYKKDLPVVKNILRSHKLLFGRHLKELL